MNGQHCVQSIRHKEGTYRERSLLDLVGMFKELHMPSKILDIGFKMVQQSLRLTSTS